MSLSQVCAKFLNVPYLPTKNNLFGRTTPIHTINNEPTITLKKNTRTIQSKRSPMSSDSFQKNCLVFNYYFVFVNYCYYIYFQFNVVSPNWASFWMPELERERFKNDWEKLGIWNFIEPAFYAFENSNRLLYQQISSFFQRLHAKNCQKILGKDSKELHNFSEPPHNHSIQFKYLNLFTTTLSIQNNYKRRKKLVLVGE